MISNATYIKYAANPSLFRESLIVDVDGVAKRLGSVMDPWQRKDFASIDPALRRCTGLAPKSKPRMRAYLERARGHSKTTDLAIVCTYALAFAQRPLRGYAYAADKDQARLLRDAMQTILRLNPWLSQILRVDAHRVVNIATGHPGEDSALEVVSSDVGSSFGILPDLIIADELTHWQGDGGLWHSIISSAAKRSSCLLMVITNAGFGDTWQWETREAIKDDPNWVFSRLDGPKASWMTKQRLEEQRRLLPPVAFARLWLNEWSTGGGDALTEADIKAAFASNMPPMTGYEPGYTWVAGVDLGLTRDCSAVVVLGVRDYDVENAGRIRLAHTKLWKPIAGQKINLTEVEDELRRLHTKFRLKAVAYDPWQAEHLSQRLVHEGFPMQSVHPSATNLQAIAARTIESFVDRRLDLYECPNLKRDLFRLRVEERSYGYRLVSPRDSEGHGDTASAFGFALLAAHEQAGVHPFIATAECGDDNETNQIMMARRFWSLGLHPPDHGFL